MSNDRSEQEIARRALEAVEYRRVQDQKAKDVGLLKLDADADTAEGAKHLIDMIDELKRRPQPQARHYGKSPMVSGAKAISLEFHQRVYETDPFRVTLTSWTLTKLSPNEFALADESVGLRLTLKSTASDGPRITSRKKLSGSTEKINFGGRTRRGSVAVKQVR